MKHLIFLLLIAPLASFGQTFGPEVLVYNSSSIPLDDGQTFTGAGQLVSSHDSVMVAVKTDQAGSYSIQFSPDGTNWDSILSRTYNPNKIHPPERFTIGRAFFRVVFTNDSGEDQSYFRLQSMVGDKQNLNFPLDGVVPKRAESTVVRGWDYKTEVGQGLREGATNWRKYGFNDDIDTTEEETIWSAGGRIQPLSSPNTLSFVSTSADDSAAGTGARTIIITGVGPDYVYQTDTITMNGTTPAVTASAWLGVNRLLVSSAGSGQVNAGDITATASTAATVQAHMPANDGTTQQVFYFVPANRTMHFDALYWNILKLAGGGSPVVTLRAYVYDLENGLRLRRFRAQVDTAVENSFMYTPPSPLSTPGKFLLEMTASTDTNNTVVNINLWGTELEND